MCASLHFCILSVFMKRKFSIFLFLCRNDHLFKGEHHTQHENAEQRKNMNVKCKRWVFLRPKYAHNKLKVLQHWAKINVESLDVRWCGYTCFLFFYLFRINFLIFCLNEFGICVNLSMVLWIQKKFMEVASYPSIFDLHSIACYLIIWIAAPHTIVWTVVYVFEWPMAGLGQWTFGLFFIF